MRRGPLIAIAILAVAIAGGFGARWAGIDIAGFMPGQPETGTRTARAATPPRQAGAPQAIPVEVSSAKAGQSSTDIPSVGTLQSDESVQVTTEVAGRISEIGFREGAPVREGDMLVRLDSALAQAELQDAEARLSLAQSNFDRAAALSKTGNVTERVRDEATATLETSRAAVELAKVRLSKMTIQAPFSGVVGVRKVSVGAYVAPGTALVNLEKIDELKLDFKVPEIFLTNVRVGQMADVLVDAIPGRKFTGTIYAIDPMVDVNGRALTIRARITNTDGVLRPGLFARINIRGDKQQNVVLVPESAIVPRGGESFVFMVKDGKAVETKVSLGGRRAGEVEILNGLESNVTVVVAGQARLRNGASVDVVTPPPANAAVPTARS